jgi:rhodanese-related sulfurtransferase
MKPALPWLTVGLALGLGVPAFAADKDKAPTLNDQLKAGEKPEKFKLIHVADLAALQQKKTPLFILDANTPSFRTKNGLIPGARQLSSANSYDFKELPEAKGSPLIFYCANTH